MSLGLMERNRALRAHIVKRLREKKRQKIAELANELGYSYHYFRYSILKQVLNDCIEYNKVNDELVWVCEG